MSLKLDISMYLHCWPKVSPPRISAIIKAVGLKTCMHIVLDECRSVAQPALQLHEVKESYNKCCQSPL